MAYSTSAPPALLVQRVGSNSHAIWSYVSTDAATAVRVDGYITNAEDLGMKVGDLVLVLDSDSSPAANHLMTVVAINANGSADLSDGTAVTATDTD